MTAGRPRSIEVIYDGECPFCRNYVAYCRLKEAADEVALTDARAVPGRVAAFRREGMDLDRGMIVIRDGQTFFGDRAVAELARLTRRRGWLARALRALFARPRVGAAAYAAMRAGRNATLRALGKPPLNPTR